LELLHELLPIACEEADAARMLGRAARLLATTLGAYCVVDLFTGEPHRVEIAHADLSRVERLRDAARSVSTVALQHTAAMARTSGGKVCKAQRALGLLGLEFVQGGAAACVVAPILLGGELYAALTLVTSRAAFAPSEVNVVSDAAAWLGLGLVRLAPRAVPRASDYPPMSREGIRSA
jgi:GAF domain-containing protein